MRDLLQFHPAIVFPVFFIGLWFAITTLLGFLSGWFRLMARYPDEAEEPILRLRGQSGTIGGWVSMRGVLTLGVCPSGLRIGITRLFGPFCRDLLVPWSELAISRRSILFWRIAELRFGDPEEGRLTISAGLADQLARAAAGRWPDRDPSPETGRGVPLRRLLAQLAAMICAAAAFFALVHVLMASLGDGPPVGMAALFPVIFVGVILVLRYLFLSR